MRGCPTGARRAIGVAGVTSKTQGSQNSSDRLSVCSCTSSAQRRYRFPQNSPFRLRQHLSKNRLGPPVHGNVQVHLQTVLGAVRTSSLKHESRLLWPHYVDLDVDYRYVTLICLLCRPHRILSKEGSRARDNPNLTPVK